MAGKIGEGHVSAMARQGLREARAAVYPESNVAQTAEYGLYGTKTPGEVAEARRDQEMTPDQEPILANRLGPVSDRSVHGMEQKQPDLSR